jgi:hypothetical protein
VPLAGSGRFAVAFVVFVATSACASAPQQSSAPPTTAGPEKPGTCDASKVQWAVGHTGDEATMARIWRESGAGLIRPLIKGQAAQRDYKPDRVNIHLDGNNKIVAVDCG